MLPGMGQIQNRPPAKTVKKDLDDLSKASKQDSAANDPRKGKDPKQGSPKQPKK